MSSAQETWVVCTAGVRSRRQSGAPPGWNENENQVWLGGGAQLGDCFVGRLEGPEVENSLGGGEGRLGHSSRSAGLNVRSHLWIYVLVLRAETSVEACLVG